MIKSMHIADELPLWSAPFGLKLLESVEYKKNMTVLDIGFYTGFPLTELAMRLGNSCLIYGIDPWAEAIALAEEKINCYGITNIKIIQGVAESIPLEDNSVDLITSNNGINNVADIDKSIRECSRIMKTNGQFIQTMNLSLSMFEFYDQLESVFIDMGMAKEVQHMYEHINKKRPSLEMIKRILQKYGYMIKDIQYDQFNYKFVDGTAMLNYYFIRHSFMDSWISLMPLHRIDEIFGNIESNLNDYAEKFGGIKLSIPFALINAIKI